MIRVLDASFVRTATELRGSPPPGAPEVAFVGRSNVGKSSAINALTGRRKLVRVSNTPGRTRALNFFLVELEVEKHRHTVSLCDLPGYGYAKVPKAERDAWAQMVSGYLSRRDCLRVVVSLVDAEVGVTPDDVQMMDFLQDSKGRIVVAATKLDRIPKAKRKPRLDAIAAALEVPRDAVVGFSSTEGLGRDELWAMLATEVVR